MLCLHFYFWSDIIRQLQTKLSFGLFPINIDKIWLAIFAIFSLNLIRHQWTKPWILSRFSINFRIHKKRFHPGRWTYIFSSFEGKYPVYHSFYDVLKYLSIVGANVKQRQNQITRFIDLCTILAYISWLTIGNAYLIIFMDKNITNYIKNSFLFPFQSSLEAEKKKVSELKDVYEQRLTQTTLSAKNEIQRLVS